MSDFANETMKIISAIQCYIDKYGNKSVIDEYYQKHDTYSGIVEYLNNIEKQEQKSQ